MYEINCDTLAIVPIDVDKTQIIEKDDSFIINELPLKIIDNSCKFFGSSYQGRFSGTKQLTGISHKAPIIIEETSEIIFFPTKSARLDDCGWISLKNLVNYEKNGDKTILTFNNGTVLELKISYGTIDNQVLRATRLESVLRLRKKTNKNNY